jgi:hypothetical protein
MVAERALDATRDCCEITLGLQDRQSKSDTWATLPTRMGGRGFDRIRHLFLERPERFHLRVGRSTRDAVPNAGKRSMLSILAPRQARIQLIRVLSRIEQPSFHLQRIQMLPAPYMEA